MEKTVSSRISLSKTRKLTLLAALTAILIVMSVTPIGYLKVGLIEITFNMIPVVIGAILLGPLGGVVLGGVFGATSFMQALGILGASPLGAVLLGINPIGMFVTCMVPRVAMGWLSALIFKGLYKIDKTKFVSFVVACLSGALLNTVLFMGSLLAFFLNTELIQGFVTELGNGNVFKFLLAFVGINGLVEAIVCTIVGAAIAKVLQKLLTSRIR